MYRQHPVKLRKMTIQCEYHLMVFAASLHDELPGFRSITRELSLVMIAAKCEMRNAKQGHLLRIGLKSINFLKNRRI